MLVALDHVTRRSWQFENGEVEIPLPLLVRDHMLTNPELIGSGGSGAVFAMEEKGRRQAVKVSWLSSADSVRREGEILQLLKARGVPNVEECIAIDSYPCDRRRTLLLLSPVFEEAPVNSLLDSRDVRRAVDCLLTTMLSMVLEASVAVADIQPLIGRETGNVLWIDFSEALTLSIPVTTLELALLTSLVSETISLIPETEYGYASRVLDRELTRISGSNDQYRVDLVDQVLELIPFIDDETK